jgi:hypothetical protein
MAVPPGRGQAMIFLIILFSFIAWTQACKSPPCARDAQNDEINVMNGLYPPPYGMTWSGASISSPPKGYHCGFYPQFNGQPATKLPRCYFEAAIRNFCEKAESFVVESLDSGAEVTALINTNISAVYDFSLAGNPRIWVSMMVSVITSSPECAGRSTNTDARNFQCTYSLGRSLNRCA